MNVRLHERRRKNEQSASPFRLVFGVTVALSTMCLTLNVVLALAVSDPSIQVQDLLSTVSTGWKMGFGAIVGLLGGKAVA